MDALNIESTENTPKVSFDAQGLNFELSGESRPEDVKKFYDPIMEWLENFNDYLKVKTASEQKSVNFNFKYEYFNSSSAKYIMDMMNKIGEIKETCPNASIIVNWHFDEMDEDMKEAGEEFEKITGIEFKFHMY